MSLDAELFGNILGHEDAYRFARGEEIRSSTGLPVKLGRPLDWLVIADHSDMMGVVFDIQRGAPNIMAIPKGKEWATGFQKGGEAAGEAAFDLITNSSLGTQDPLDLYQWLADYESKTGGQALAISHNGNLLSISVEN